MTERLDPLDTLVWAVDDGRRRRTTIAALARTRRPVDRRRLRGQVLAAVDALPRLRQRVIAGPPHDPGPRWQAVDRVELGAHLRIVDGRDEHGAGIDDAALERLAADLVAQPLDRSRPLWRFTLVEHCADGGSALLLTAHHSVSDGIRGVEMMLALFELAPVEPVTSRSSPPPSGDDDPARRLGAAIGAAARALRPRSADRLVATDRSGSIDVTSLTVDLDDLRRAGRRVEGTINDAFVAAVVLGLADHHRRPGALRLSIPVDTGSTGHGGGNHWMPTHIDLTIDPRADPDATMRFVREQVARARRGSTAPLLGPLADVARRIPGAVTTAAYDALSGNIDVTASNVPGSPVPLLLCGEEVERLVPFGPLAGGAVNVTLLSHGRTAEVGIVTDPAAITEPDRLRDDLRSAFHAVTKGS